MSKLAHSNQETMDKIETAARQRDERGDFDLDRSRWYSLMKLGLETRNARASAEQITKWAAIFSNFDYEPCAGTELATAETALTEALLAVQVARASYERVTNEQKPHFQPGASNASQSVSQ